MQRKAVESKGKKRGKKWQEGRGRGENKKGEKKQNVETEKPKWK
ncbi:hypothetical protein ACEE54_11585 [Staphylococcus hyicus]